MCAVWSRAHLRQARLPKLTATTDEGELALEKELFLVQDEIRRCELEISTSKSNEEVGWLAKRQARDAKLKLEVS